jgi:tRNA threonylcarbamoyladenosine biosynthesis protein TsaE
MKTWTFLSRSLDDTTRLGKAIGEAVGPGAVISLVGPLGAGKTNLTRAIAVGLGINEADVSSPTFMLIQEYEGRLPLYHFDTYRLKDLEEFEDLGPDEYFYGEGVCLVEWGDRVQELLPPDHLRIEIEVTGETARRFLLEAHGKTSEELVSDLASRIS